MLTPNAFFLLHLCVYVLMIPFLKDVIYILNFSMTFPLIPLKTNT